MALVKNSRLIYVDSAAGVSANRGKAKIIVPNHPFTVGRDDRMALTLCQLTVRRQWYSINQTNNTLYLYTEATDTYTEVAITPGEYDSFNELALAIQAALQTVLAAVTCTYDAVTRRRREPTQCWS